MGSLADRLIKNSTIENTSLILESKIYTEKDMVLTPVPMINVALSGRVNGGLTPGLTLICGMSKHFKSLFSLLMAASYMKKHSDAVLLFYDTEFGTPSGYFDSLSIDMNRVVYTPVTNIEELKFDISKQLAEISRDDKVIIVIDSIGNLASIKEVEDALEGKSVADMSRAKALKSLFRIVTPHLTIKDIPLIAVNHVYKELGMFPKDIVGGGQGIYLSSDTIWIIGRQQEKTGTGSSTKIVGYNFIINVEKSRYVKEKSKIPISVTYEGGIQKWSGMLQVAIDAGVLEVVGRSVVFGGEKYAINKIENDDEFWVTKVFANSNLDEYIKNRFMVVHDKPLAPKFMDEE